MDSPFNNAGASAVQELAFILATAVEYLNEMISRGLKADDVAKELNSLLVSDHFTLWKLRNFVLQECCGVKFLKLMK